MTDMGDRRPEALFRDLTTSWEKALNDGQRRDVILGGLVAYSHFYDTGETTLATAALIYVRQAIDEQLAATIPEQGPSPKAHCSFCGLAEPQVRLAAGGTAFICASCVRTLGNVFKQ